MKKENKTILKIILLIFAIVLILSLHIIDNFPDFIAVNIFNEDGDITVVSNYIVKWFGVVVNLNLIYDIVLYTLIFDIIVIIYLELKTGGGKP